ncbi:MAG: yqhD [Proteobacteria bacterium]|nr:yqhD [Pseudomonadota bacterium]
MDNFSYFNPTKLFFGKGQIAAIGEAIPKDQKVLVLYGGGSIKKNGVLDQVHAALAGHTFLEFSGIEPNPHYETLMKAVELIKREGVQYLLAVGGGSVIDGTKFISAAACYEGGEPWDMIEKGITAGRALPVGCVLTLPATGSESNTFSVISHVGKGLKRAYGDPLTYPAFAVLDPQVTYSLPRHQVANGVVDAFVHVMEQYMTYPAGGAVQDRYAEGLLQTLVEIGEKVVNTTDDYDSRATFMWAANQALNGLIGQGVPQDWSTHMIGHELTAVYGLDHAVSLAAVLTHNLQVNREAKRAKLLQYAARVWNINEGSEDARIDAAIAKTAAFFESVGLKSSLKGLGIEAAAADKIAGRLETQGLIALGEHQSVTPAVVSAILNHSLA